MHRKPSWRKNVNDNKKYWHTYATNESAEEIPSEIVYEKDGKFFYDGDCISFHCNVRAYKAPIQVYPTKKEAWIAVFDDMKQCYKKYVDEHNAIKIKAKQNMKNDLRNTKKHK